MMRKLILLTPVGIMGILVLFTSLVCFAQEEEDIPRKPDLESLLAGPKAPDNPWGAATLEWQSDSPPPHENPPAPEIISDSYDFDEFEFDEETQGYVKMPK